MMWYYYYRKRKKGKVKTMRTPIEIKFNTHKEAMEYIANTTVSTSKSPMFEGRSLKWIVTIYVER